MEIYNIIYFIDENNEKSKRYLTLELIWYAGPYIDIPIEKEGNYETFYGIMAAAQLEILSHYFVRGEYQWALKSDFDYIEDRRTNMLSVSFGYRF